ncbi:MAG: lysostaphin resistance A-like protein [Thermogutta sp.]
MTPFPSPEELNRQNRNAAAQLVLMGTLAECGLGFIALAGALVFAIPIRDHCHWSVRALVQGLAATLPMFFVLCLVELAPGKAFARLRALVDILIRPLIRAARIPELALLSLAAGLGEEVFFRGFVQTGILQLVPAGGFITGMSWESPALAIILAAIFFGLAHPLSACYIVLTVIMGAYLGVLFHLTGNLLTCIVAHAAYDFVALLYLGRFRRERPARR